MAVSEGALALHPSVDIATALAPWQVIGAAIEAGALSPADVVHRGVEVEQVGRSHVVYRVCVGGRPSFFLKCFGPNRGATDGTAAQERAVLALADERPAVAALVPRRWRWDAPDGDHPLVATEAVDGAEAWRLDRFGGGTHTIHAAWEALIPALVPPLAAFHRATRDLARAETRHPTLPSREPWALCLMDGDAAAELWRAGPTAALLREASGDPVLVRGLRAARGLWRPLALVHSDLKHDNVLVDHTTDVRHVRIVDWEMARIGDPAWDLGAMTARLTSAKADDEPPWSEDELAAAATLVSAYAAESGLRIPGLAHRLAHYTGAVLLMMAVQVASTADPRNGLDPARLLLMRARATFAQIHQVASGITDRASATPR